MMSIAEKRYGVALISSIISERFCAEVEDCAECPFDEECIKNQCELALLRLKEKEEEVKNDAS